MTTQFDARFSGGIEINDISVNGELLFRAIKRENFAGGWDLYSLTGTNEEFIEYFPTLFNVREFIEK